MSKLLTDYEVLAVLRHHKEHDLIDIHSSKLTTEVLLRYATDTVVDIYIPGECFMCTTEPRHHQELHVQGAGNSCVYLCMSVALQSHQEGAVTAY